MAALMGDFLNVIAGYDFPKLPDRYQHQRNQQLSAGVVTIATARCSRCLFRTKSWCLSWKILDIYFTFQLDLLEQLLSVSRHKPHCSLADIAITLYHSRGFFGWRLFRRTMLEHVAFFRVTAFWRRFCRGFHSLTNLTRVTLHLYFHMHQ